jgi:FHS family Na+ dependent glucose MFS transporter 1
MMFVYVGCEISYGNYISKYAFDLGLTTEASAAFLASGFWGALTAGRLIGIPLSARYSARAILLVDLLITLLGVGVIIAAPASLTVLWIGTVLVGAGMASVFPTVLILAEQNMTMTAFVTSWFFVGSSSGGMTLVWLIGQLFARSGPSSMMMVLLIGLLFCLLLFGVIVLYTRGRKKAAE